MSSSPGSSTGLSLCNTKEYYISIFLYAEAWLFPSANSIVYRSHYGYSLITFDAWVLSDGAVKPVKICLAPIGCIFVPFVFKRKLMMILSKKKYRCTYYIPALGPTFCS